MSGSEWVVKVRNAIKTLVDNWEKAKTSFWKE